mmetsp:Transcript_47390/g.144199  ORF Transcript_47390/g.144199 Transcript_47390/m.144199 type:complete len:113 (-) Transcript_47390:145-483(-)
MPPPPKRPCPDPNGSAPWYAKIVHDGHDWAKYEDRCERHGPFRTRAAAVRKALSEADCYDLEEDDVNKFRKGKIDCIDFDGGEHSGLSVSVTQEEWCDESDEDESESDDESE